MGERWNGSFMDEKGTEAESAIKAAHLLRALANPHRLLILKLLQGRPHNVMEICERLGLRQSLASQHLARLRLDGIVSAERRGHNVVYSLAGGPTSEILALLEGMAASGQIQPHPAAGPARGNGSSAGPMAR